jgi:hypothetical protein
MVSLLVISVAVIRILSDRSGEAGPIGFSDLGPARMPLNPKSRKHRNFSS